MAATRRSMSANRKTRPRCCTSAEGSRKVRRPQCARKARTDRPASRASGDAGGAEERIGPGCELSLADEHGDRQGGDPEGRRRAWRTRSTSGSEGLATSSPRRGFRWCSTPLAPGARRRWTAATIPGKDRPVFTTFRYYFSAPEGSKDPRIYFEGSGRLFQPDGKPFREASRFRVG